MRWRPGFALLSACVASSFVLLGGCATTASTPSETTGSTVPPAPSAAAATAAEAPAAQPYEQAVAAATDPLSPSRLILVSRYGHDRVVRYLLDNHVNVNARDNFGGTPLIAAAEGGHEKVIDMLIQAGADVNAHSQDGLTALMAAAARGNPTIINALLAAGAQVNAADSIGETALFYAVKLGQLDAARLLLGAGADPNLQNTNRISASNSGFTALMYAAEHGYGAAKGDWPAMTRLLVEKGARPNVRNNHGDSALTLAERRADREVVAVLTGSGAREERSYTSLSDDASLIKAARIGDADKVTTLLRSGINADVRNDSGITPLLAAAYEGHVAVVRALVEKGANVNSVPQGLREWAMNASRVSIADQDLVEAASRGDDALIVAIRRGHDSVVEYLLSRGADPNLANNRGEAPIFVAAGAGRTKMVKLLLGKGVDPDTLELEKLTVSMSHSLQSMGRNTPIITAAQMGHEETVAALIAAGANVNHAGFLNKTALIWSAERGYAPVAEVLLKANADPNVNDVEGLTPLMLAARNGNTRIAKLLLDRDADPNKIETPDYPGDGGKAFGRTGMTALIYAARGGHDEIVRMLIGAKADVNAMTHGGDTAIKEASTNGYQQIVELLKVSGAQ